MPTRTYNTKGAALGEGSPKHRVAPALRRAMKLRVENNLNIGDACKLAGYSESGWHLAMKRPAVKAELQKLQEAFISNAQGRREYLKARALTIAEELMEAAETNADKWKAVEFFTREAAKHAPPVTVNVGQSPGYAYIRPGDRVIDVTPDSLSGGQEDKD